MDLTAKEFDLMELLMRNPGRVYSRENLLNVVWGYEYIGDFRTVDVHIRRLREKLELDPANPEYIRARDIMRRRPITISRGRTVLQALQIMRQSGVDSLLVVDGRDRLLGVLWLEELMSEKDGSGSAETYLSDDYVAVEGDTTLKEIISTIDYDVSGIIPVIEHDRTLVGFLTKSSLLATMSRQFVPEHTAGERSGVIWAAAAH